MGHDEDGTGAWVGEYLWVESAVATWRGGRQDKAGCWYLHADSLGDSGLHVGLLTPSGGGVAILRIPPRQPLSGPQGTHQEKRGETRS